MGHQIVDDETHVLSNCDLYSTLRSKLITTLNKSPHSENIENYQQLNVTQESESHKDHLINLLSPHFNSQELTESEININQLNQHHSDNYRAIAVWSNLGKLFSSIMLERLIQFRKYTIHMSRHRKPTWVLSPSPNCRPPFLVAYMH